MINDLCIDFHIERSETVKWKKHHYSRIFMATMKEIKNNNDNESICSENSNWNYCILCTCLCVSCVNDVANVEKGSNRTSAIANAFLVKFFVFIIRSKRRAFKKKKETDKQNNCTCYRNVHVFFAFNALFGLLHCCFVIRRQQIRLLWFASVASFSFMSHFLYFALQCCAFFSNQMHTKKNFWLQKNVVATIAFLIKSFNVLSNTKLNM